MCYTIIAIVIVGELMVAEVVNQARCLVLVSRSIADIGRLGDLSGHFLFVFLFTSSHHLTVVFICLNLFIYYQYPAIHQSPVAIDDPFV